MQTIDYYLYDIYILRFDGMPLYGGCTGSPYCESHIANHYLHCGFFSALNAFSNEVFPGKKLHHIEFDDIRISFKIDRPNELIFIFVHPSAIPQFVIQEKLNVTRVLFLKQYAHLIENNFLDLTVFESFPEILYKFNIIKRQKLYPTKEMQKLYNECKLSQIEI